ncbi:MAG TPA: alpha/beta hydrolase [Verrucomicrobiae bacterium]|nr:alpha/beta hydrolase [Verrucomicrobiae bacterium]
MKKVLLTITDLIGRVLGMNIGCYYLRLQVFASRAASLLGMNSGRFAFKFIDAGGHRLRMLICGRGVPTVVFEAGGYGARGNPLEAWKRVQPEVSRFTSTVAYDRAAIGLSAPGPQPRDARQIARELHTALGNARVAPPYILVGSSFGGPLIRVFAGMFPADVSGMVLVDPAQEEYYNWTKIRDPRASDDDWRGFLASLAQAHESRVPEGIPVVLITATVLHVLPIFLTAKQKELFRKFMPMWLKFHAEWVRKLPNGQHIITNNSGHSVAFEEPELIVRVIRQMVEQVRSRQ